MQWLKLLEKSAIAGTPLIRDDSILWGASVTRQDKTKFIPQTKTLVQGESMVKCVNDVK